MEDIVTQLRSLAKDAAIRSVPKLLRTAATEGLKATKKQAEDALRERVPAQLLAPGPTSRAHGKAFSESPESRYSCDLIDFSQNTAKPGYILVLMQTWSRRIWATSMNDKSVQQTNAAIQRLIEQADAKDADTHDLLHDAGKEFAQLHRALPENWVDRTKDPLDRNGLSTLDRGVMELKKNLEDIIEEEGGDWRTHLDAAVRAYNRSYHSAVLGAPSKAENGSIKEFLIREENADNMYHNSQLTQKRIEAVQKEGYFREATGAKRSFNQAYGPKLKLEEVLPGGGYIKGSDDQLHLLKRVIPVAKNSAEPKGKLTQPRQYLADSLRDMAEDLHAELKGSPKTIKEISETLDPKLLEKEAKIKTKAFVEKFSDLFQIKGDKVYALVASNARKPRSEGVKKVTAMEESSEAPPIVEGGSSSSRAFSDSLPQGYSKPALYFRGVVEQLRGDREAKKRERLDAKTAAENLRNYKRDERRKAQVEKEYQKMMREVEREIKRTR
jgi:hypothetical protein